MAVLFDGEGKRFFYEQGKPFGFNANQNHGYKNIGMEMLYSTMWFTTLIASNSAGFVDNGCLELTEFSLTD